MAKVPAHYTWINKTFGKAMKSHERLGRALLAAGPLGPKQAQLVQLRRGRGRALRGRRALARQAGAQGQGEAGGDLPHPDAAHEHDRLSRGLGRALLGARDHRAEGSRSAAREPSQCRVPAADARAGFASRLRAGSTGASLPLALLLVLAVAAIYGQTFRHEFIAFDDDTYIYNNPAVTDGLTWNGSRLGLRLPRRELAPADLALPHARRPALRTLGGGAPSRERRAARRQRRAAAGGPDGDDRRLLAQRRRGRPLRAAPAARGVGGLGRRAQGRPVGLVLAADDGGLPALRPPPRRRADICAALGLFAARARCEADARHPPLRPAAARLVAARARAPARGAPMARARSRAPAPGGRCSPRRRRFSRCRWPRAWSPCAAQTLNVIADGHPRPRDAAGQCGRLLPALPRGLLLARRAWLFSTPTPARGPGWRGRGAGGARRSSPPRCPTSAGAVPTSRWAGSGTSGPWCRSSASCRWAPRPGATATPT